MGEMPQPPRAEENQTCRPSRLSVQKAGIINQDAGMLGRKASFIAKQKYVGRLAILQINGQKVTHCRINQIFLPISVSPIRIIGWRLFWLGPEGAVNTADQAQTIASDAFATGLMLIRRSDPTKGLRDYHFAGNNFFVCNIHALVLEQRRAIAILRKLGIGEQKVIARHMGEATKVQLIGKNLAAG